MDAGDKKERGFSRSLRYETRLFSHSAQIPLLLGNIVTKDEQASNIVDVMSQMRSVGEVTQYDLMMRPKCDHKNDIVNLGRRK